MQNFQSLGATREGGRADGSTLTLPIGLSIRKLRLGHFSRGVRAASLEGLRLHPVPFRNFRGDAAKLLFSSTKRNHPHLSSSSCPGASKKTGASSGRTVPFRRNPEQLNFTGKQAF